MKINTKILAVMLIMVSCGDSNLKKVPSDSGEKYNIEVIDGCEYLMRQSGAQEGYMAHKGNCSNPIHCRNGKN